MDIVERLRSPEVFLSNGLYSPVAYEAADEIERLREALGFYGNQHNWHPSVEFVENIPTHLGQSQIEIDGGDKARSALQQKDSE